ncbi:MAG: hypothetical protein OXU45_04125 [Candidatus Melainabacteria bacterium]|nr:hypothetical protein [Candidatus Melainabacteria bacterium]
MASKKDKSKDRKPDDIIELLEDLYEPNESEMTEFDLFFDGIEQKIDEQNPVNRISKIGDKIEDNINYREQKLSQLVRRLEQKSKTKARKQKKSPNRFLSILSAAALVTLIALAGFAGFKNFKSYNYINLEAENIDWDILKLSKEQKDQLQEIDNQWLSLKTQEEAFIEDKRATLIAEMNQPKPNFSLIDKYQREILDHEVMLKRTKLNSFLEKRFILNEEQSLKLIREIGKQASENGQKKNRSK